MTRLQNPDPARKRFRLRADEIRPLATNMGACFATDMILVDGFAVGFMYREEPDTESDSGWRFLSGHESQEYLDAPSHTGIYDVNTVANYDAAIIPYLHSPVGSAFERPADGGAFQPASPPLDPDGVDDPR